MFLLDESFAEFDETYRYPDATSLHNLLIARSMTKLFTVPGLRVGYAHGHPDLIRTIRHGIPPWSVNAFAQAFAGRAYADSAYINHTRRTIRADREGLSRRIKQLPGTHVFPTQANFLLLRLPSKLEDLVRRLLEQEGIAVRDCGNFDGLDPSYIRVAVKRRGDNERLCDALERHLL
ncbi:TPA: hypothetical protein DCE37_25850 [Candidatus Latescibacteria bacterium]|nr:hypothetical protein [Candidatus Latescibacterota bacterium]